MSTSAIEWPKKTRELKEELTDSARWNNFPWRDDDIIIASWGKAGTSWLQQIVAQLVFDGKETPTGDLSPWFDFIMVPKDQLVARLEAQTHRRFIKTHLPVDALGIRPEVKYLYIARDGRDIVWSNHKFVSNVEASQAPMSQEARTALADRPRANPDIRLYFHEWLDGKIYADRPFFAHLQGWWDIRHLSNVLLMHYNNLKADLEGQIRRIAGFLDLRPSASAWPYIIEHCTFDYMKQHADQVAPLGARRMTGGSSEFFHKGTNGRWRDVLTAEDIRDYEESVAENLTPECARWLATGEGPT